MEAVIEFDAVHTRQPVVQHKEARREVPHQLQCGMAVACHDGPIGRLLRNRLNEECANVRIVLDEEDRVGCRLRFSRYVFCILKHRLAPTLSVDTECAPSLTRERRAKRFKDLSLTPEAHQVREREHGNWGQQPQAIGLDFTS